MRKPLLLAAFGLSLAGCFHTSCVARGSRVLTPDGWRPIEDLAIDDLVYCVDEDTGERIATPVVAIKSSMREVGCVEVAGISLRMTSDHPVYCPVDEVYAPAGDWFLGKRTELAITSDAGLERRTVDRVTVYVEVTEVFDISVEHELHNFVAEGVLVHNKKVARTCRFEGQTVMDGAACGCPGGEGGYVRCDEPALCYCGGDDNNMPDGSPGDAGPDVSTTDADEPTDTSTVDASAPDSSGPDGGPDVGMLRHRGTCVTSADCADATWECVSIPVNDAAGYHTCQAPTTAEPGCGTIEDPDTCCLHTDCNQADPSAVCVTGPIFYCGGAAPPIANACLADECVTNAECGADDVCVPARVLGEPVARCVTTRCQFDADCSAGARGECTPFFNPCNSRFIGFSCTYDDSACRSNEDCDQGNAQYCAPGTGDGDTACVEFLPPP